MSESAIRALDLRKTFEQAGTPIHVLQGVDFDVPEGQTVAILGQSGSGKSTLLALLAGLDRPTSGQIYLAGRDIGSMSEKELAAFRARRLGIVFQQFHLMSYLTALENVSLPLEILKIPDAQDRARELLGKVGLGHRLQHLPYQLSGGEKQRVAIARAFVTEPKLLLADEPSGSLDVHTGDEVMALLFERIRAARTSLILVTHNQALAARCDRTLSLLEGRLVEQGGVRA